MEYFQEIIWKSAYTYGERIHCKSQALMSQEDSGGTYLWKHGEAGSVKCWYGFARESELMQIQQKYCMQLVHVILLQPSIFWGENKKLSNQTVKTKGTSHKGSEQHPQDPPSLSRQDRAT